MSKKLILEFFLLLLIIVISITIFNFYFNESEKKTEFNPKITKENKLKPSLDNETASIIKNIDYSFVDKSDNSYKIFAEFGKIDIDQPDIINMTNVTAFAYLKNTEPIEIKSKYASYNKSNNDTNFNEDVNLKYLDHNAKSQNLDLLFMKNIILMYNNLVYVNDDIQLLADKLLFDIKTKNAKIYMDDNSKKVKVVKY
ncbi:MAG: hypothetical protein CBE35_00300 [Candidatus Pelagibacter sp. TMED275]|nr:MAG: hypothetical protein CBE35_00300 [Candidatus Pelagibacter sp. TMED275]|tara:strand:+ start:2613 stop:3206 length:594 start_codon:yes stop_codon:yes gene_type:complete